MEEGLTQWKFPCELHSLFVSFLACLCRKFIEVTIIDDEEYEKEENFYVELGQPKLIKRGNGKKPWQLTGNPFDQLLYLSVLTTFIVMGLSTVCNTNPPTPFPRAICVMI